MSRSGALVVKASVEALDILRVRIGADTSGVDGVIGEDDPYRDAAAAALYRLDAYTTLVGNAAVTGHADFELEEWAQLVDDGEFSLLDVYEPEDAELAAAELKLDKEIDGGGDHGDAEGDVPASVDEDEDDEIGDVVKEDGDAEGHSDDTDEPPVTKKIRRMQ